MKKFSEKINESMMDKDPIDPSEDVKEFRDKFRIISNQAKSILNDIESSYPTMTDEYDIYLVSEVDNNGYENNNIGYFNAVSEIHAKIKAANLKNREDIFSTGYFRATKLLPENIERVVKNLEKKIQEYQHKLENLKNPI